MAAVRENEGNQVLSVSIFTGVAWPLPDAWGNGTDPHQHVARANDVVGSGAASGSSLGERLDLSVSISTS